MSTTGPTPTTTASTSSTSSFFTDNPSATNGGNGNGGGFGSQSTPLYLFTFLATLFVLLFVSCAIVLRSFFLRRRLRQRIDEAMAAGVWPPPQAGPGVKRRDFGEKPKLWDAPLLHAAPSDGQWEKLKPVSVQVTSIERPQSPSSPPTPPPSLLNKINPLSHLRSWRRSRSSSSLSSSLDSATHLSSMNANMDETISRATEAEVSVIIAMPNPNRPTYGLTMERDFEYLHHGKGKQRRFSSSSESYWDDHEEGVPDVVLGVTRVPVKGTDLGRSTSAL